MSLKKGICLEPGAVLPLALLPGRSGGEAAMPCHKSPPGLTLLGDFLYLGRRHQYDADTRHNTIDDFLHWARSLLFLNWLEEATAKYNPMTALTDALRCHDSDKHLKARTSSVVLIVIGYISHIIN